MTSRSTLILPIAIGAGWLLAVQGFIPQINWVWTLGLAAAGLLTFVLSGWNKVSFVAGLFFLAAGLLSILRQIDRLNTNTEVPLLILLLGVLTLTAHLPAIPAPVWAQTTDPERAES